MSTNVGTRNQKFDYEMNDIKLDSLQYVKDLGVSIASNLKFSQQCKDAASKALYTGFFPSRIKI